MLDTFKNDISKIWLSRVVKFQTFSKGIKEYHWTCWGYFINLKINYLTEMVIFYNRIKFLYLLLVSSGYKIEELNLNLAM
jgi:hypothetical protein